MSVNPDLALVAAHKPAADDRPIVMVNLFKLKHGVTLQAYVSAFRDALGSRIADVGAETTYVGAAGPEFIGGGDWDYVMLVRYPTYRAFRDLVENPTWGAEVGAVRDAHLERACLLLTTPLED